MTHLENRDKIIERIKKELIGPGSDIFLCNEDFSNEIIEGKPLQRYFSAILFPKQKMTDDSEIGKDAYTEEEDGEVLATDNLVEPEFEDTEKEEIVTENDLEEESDIVPKFNSNSFFPSHFGFSFCITKKTNEINLQVSFGNYKKAKVDEVLLPYGGDDINYLNEFGFDQFVIFNEETKTLKQSKVIKRKENGLPTPDYSLLQSAFNSIKADNKHFVIYKCLTKLLFKDKYKRFHNEIIFPVKVTDLLNSENNHTKIILSQIPNVNSDSWHKENKHNLILHVKLYDTGSNRYFIKAVIENQYGIKKDQFSLSKEKLNHLALFQTEIKVISNDLLPFRDYHPNLYKSEEDKMLDYLFREKLTYGIGHNTSCTWEYCEQNQVKPSWIKTTFLPAYNVKNQSTETDKIQKEILNIKNLSSFGKDKNQIIRNLNRIADAYLKWINEENESANGNEFGVTNIRKCKEVYNRIIKGIYLLSQNENAYKAFQLANTSIYIQMFQNEWHFTKKDGYEVFERSENLQLNYNDYATSSFPNGKKEPSWRPFQLAFILQCLPSFIEEDSSDRDLVDLLHFPTGGGKTEAYLAISAFLIFWRRLTFSKNYDGINIIIRYTLRLLSAQQFERATKLILACEFIRLNNQDLGSERISIGFWIGNATIPNNLQRAKEKYNLLLQKLNTNSEGKKVVNPFQLTNCQWCNTKIISRINTNDKTYSIGHRINNRLQSYCLNSKCSYSESNGGLPIVLIDDDIYFKPPTVLFGTVDKFATLAWKGEAINLFNFRDNRKPELIIQDELHLLNGPLGSLVGLFENVILSLCTSGNQKPKIIASTATIKNVKNQIHGLYGREVRIFPQHATNSDDTFFSKTLNESKREYIGILPTGKTSVMTNLQLLAALLFARLEIWEQSPNKKDVDQFWTLLSYFKSLKEIGRFSNKISSELKPIIQQLQVRYLKNKDDLIYNYLKLPYRNLELTSRIPNERIKKNLDMLEIQFDGELKAHKAYDLVLATNMISVGLDVGRLGIMVMNGMPPNTAEYIQASSRVARKNEGLVVTLFDPFNSRDLSFYEDFVQFHKTFYRQVEPLSVTPFADSALDKMFFTLLVTFFRHKMGFAANDMASALIQKDIKTQLQDQFFELFKNHSFAAVELTNIKHKIETLIQSWQYRIDAVNDLKFFWFQHPNESLMKPLQDKRNEDDVLIAMQSMRNVEPNAEIFIKQH